MKALHKGFRVLTNIVTWAAILFILAGVAVMFVPRFFGISPYVVLSGSMEPVIHTGSLVYISEQEGEPEVGDIVAYKIGDLPVVHRIIEEVDGGYITKGDANEAVDLAIVEPSKVIGKYVFTVPAAGYILTALQSNMLPVGNMMMPLAIPVAVVLVLALNLIEYILRLAVRSMRKDNDE